MKNRITDSIALKDGRDEVEMLGALWGEFWGQVQHSGHLLAQLFDVFL
jgi:hypothetical protein